MTYHIRATHVFYGQTQETIMMDATDSEDRKRELALMEKWAGTAAKQAHAYLALRKLLAKAYREGWDQSKEGYNAEYPDGADKTDLWKYQQSCAVDRLIREHIA